METLTMSLASQATLKKSKLIYLFLICFLSSVFAGMVSTLMSVYLPVVVKELQLSQDASQLNLLSGYINSLFIFGWAIGGFLWGLISDKTGRKIALLLAIASYGIFTISTGFSYSWWVIMLCRFMSGFGVGGVLVVSFTLLSEVWPPKSKAVVTGILSIAFPVGIFSAGLINYFVSSWRQGFLIGTVPILLALTGTWVLVESPLWLMHKERGLTVKVEKLFSDKNSKTLFLGALIFGTMLIGLWAIFSWMPTWIQSLITGDAQKQRGLSMMFLGMGGLAGGFFSGWLVNFAGLRKSMITCFAVCAVLSFILFKTNSTFSSIIYLEIAILALFFGASQGILSVYIPQMFPTAVRASATGFCFNAGRLFTATAVLFIGILVSSLGGYGNALFIFSTVFLIGLITVLTVRNILPDKLV